MELYRFIIAILIFIYARYFYFVLGSENTISTVMSSSFMLISFKTLF